MVTQASTLIEWEVSRGNTGIDPNQWNFKAYYLYGAVAPQTGESFWLEFSHLDGICFQMFLDKLAKGLLNNRSLFQEQERSISESWVKNKFFCIELPHLYSATRYS